MSVIPFTLFFSLVLTGLFIVLFAREQRRRRFTSAESDSLLPLAEERTRLVNLESHPKSGAEQDLWMRSERIEPALTAPDHSHDDHDEVNHARTGHVHIEHAHDDANCGCRSGKKAPCPGCLKRPAHSTSASPSL